MRLAEKEVAEVGLVGPLMDALVEQLVQAGKSARG